MPSKREVIPDLERADFSFEVPGMDGLVLQLPYAKWEAFHERLGQELAKRMRLEA